eukprot:TRINITY_DN3072_c4_g1_i1.p2 TRINITY_DN3072_c4_g1~~TRINITY_DN3072_c4_g1_i1.p2  ORF type:complete len:344 (+),score=147.74 TRINITY_DN3072_c4_g1_i1:114-1145(+)
MEEAMDVDAAQTSPAEAQALPSDPRAALLLQAAVDGRLDDLKRLVSEGVDVSPRDEHGRTPLHFAALNGHEAMVDALLEAGHPYNVLDDEYRTAGEYAEAAGHAGVYERLLDEGCRSELILGLLGRKDKDQAAPNADYLERRLHYSEGKLLDSDNNAVMMGWELPLMQRHAALLCPREGLDVLNVGFGLGLMDIEYQKYRPATHTIIEAHPDVYAHMLATGWDKRPGVRIIFGRWQDVVEQLGTFDAIYFDTFGEYYDDLREFNEHVVNLLRTDGSYSFFNGLAGTNSFFHAIYCRLAALELAEMGLQTHYTPIDMDASRADWDGVKRQYWTLKTYNLPTCRF